MSTAEDILFAHGAPGSQDERGRRRIDITREDEALLNISDAINARVLPDTYVRSGQVTQVAEVDHGQGPRLMIREMGPAALRMQLARHAAVFRTKLVKEELIETSALPSVAAAQSVLSQAEWPGLPPLAGVTSMPMIRPDGTTLTTPGYDHATRLYYRPAFAVAPVADWPAPAAVAEARRYVLDYVLADFSWDSDASRANYFAMLLTPIMRLYIDGVVPFGLISATTRGSGKSLLMEIMKAVYGLRMTPWVRKEDEMTKVITSILRDTTEPVIVWDNVNTFDTIDHGVLAALLTSTEWSSRLLGASDMVSATNDRMWLATGNNLAVGGDMASRSVLARLDPQMERPEERDGFQIRDLWAWLAVDTNRAQLLRALLILVRAWIADGAPRDTSIKMRNFSAWAQVMGGLTAFHGVDGFLANKDQIVTGGDEEETSTAAFVAKWFDKYGSAPKRTTELVDSARGDHFGGTYVDPWDGTFPSSYKDGRNVPFSSKGLGKFLAARDGRIFGGLKIVREYNSASKIFAYRVVQHSPEAKG
ncbi:hypothetical protein ACQPYK_08655 [Streptosporangium sp. CA-135522]|uniref:hypothetical protein n=1 Tax=Streptosporangium sp. CA-135522 TaxID=3240072 RepID=UPI003D915F24